MASKRKTVEVDTKPVGAGGKRVKTENDKDTTKTRDDKAGVKCEAKEWEYKSGKTWKLYNSVDNKTISKAFASGKPHAEIVTPRTSCHVIFARMVQRNTKTGWEVAVRCKADDTTAADKKYVWQWKNNQKSWQTYSEGVCRLFDAATSHGLKTVAFQEDKKDYTFDLLKKEQQGVSNKGGKCPVRHILEEVAVHEAKTQAASNTAATNGADNKKKSSSKQKKTTATAVVKDEKKSVKSVVFKGKSPVDDVCPIKDKVQVFCEGDTVWDAMLNQTNLKNNNNKYYLMQVLQDNTTNRYHVWFRWGRVGFAGQNNLTSYGGDLDGAKSVFMKKFSDKTKNDWEERDIFEKVPGKYDLVFVDYNAEEKDVTDAPPSEKPIPESKLNKRLQMLIELICNVRNMEDAVKEMKYDTNKSPLGKLTKEQIKAGYKALKLIDQCISKKDFGAKLVQACDAFYTRIPHCFGMKQPPLIRTKEDVKFKMDLLEALGDIEIAMKVLKEELDVNPVDSHYKAINCELSPLDKTHDTFQMIDKYIQNTHAKTHNQYKIIVEDIFEIDHPHNSNFVDKGNRMLLWHGSRLTNWVGILNEGLRIAPPEAPVTGYMFGKGVYFADMCSKSANYCYTNRRQNTGLLVLSEVSLGKTNDLLAADYDAATLPDGCHSVRGLGKIGPDPSENETLPDGTIVPLGKGVETGVTNPNGYTLNYNEYIVYDTKQVKMKYLVKCKFNYI